MIIRGLRLQESTTQTTFSRPCCCRSPNKLPPQPEPRLICHPKGMGQGRTKTNPFWSHVLTNRFLADWVITLSTCTSIRVSPAYATGTVVQFRVESKALSGTAADSRQQQSHPHESQYSDGQQQYNQGWQCSSTSTSTSDPES